VRNCWLRKVEKKGAVQVRANVQTPYSLLVEKSRTGQSLVFVPIKKPKYEKFRKKIVDKF